MLSKDSYLNIFQLIWQFWTIHFLTKGMTMDGNNASKVVLFYTQGGGAYGVYSPLLLLFYLFLFQARHVNGGVIRDAFL